MDEAIRYLMEMSEPRSKISDLAGLWDVTDEEVEEILASLRRGWKSPKST